MTLENLKTRCSNAKIQYAYGVFKNAVEPPFLVAISTSTDNFMADNKVYVKDTPIQLDYMYKEKDTTTESLIEDTILADVAWNKSDEAYLEDEDIFVVSYFFEVDTKADDIVSL